MTGSLSVILREVLAVQAPRQILLRLAATSAPIKYSDLRRDLELHAQSFARALDRLEEHGMIGRRLRGKPNNLGRREVYLEATSIGHFWAQRWTDWRTGTKRAAAAQQIPLADA